MGQRLRDIDDIIWHQTELFPPTLTTIDLRLSVHGPTSDALLGVSVWHGEPGDLVMSQLSTGVPMDELTDRALVLLMHVLAHELANVSPF